MFSGYPEDAFLAQLVEKLHNNLGIEHPTIQIETGEGASHFGRNRKKPERLSGSGA